MATPTKQSFADKGVTKLELGNEETRKRGKLSLGVAGVAKVTINAGVNEKQQRRQERAKLDRIRSAEKRIEKVGDISRRSPRGQHTQSYIES